MFCIYRVITTTADISLWLAHIPSLLIVRLSAFVCVKYGASFWKECPVFFFRRYNLRTLKLSHWKILNFAAATSTRRGGICSCGSNCYSSLSSSIVNTRNGGKLDGAAEDDRQMSVRNPQSRWVEEDVRYWRRDTVRGSNGGWKAQDERTHGPSAGVRWSSQSLSNLRWKYDRMSRSFRPYRAG